MRSIHPPLLMSGPDDPHALDNIPIRMRPSTGTHMCGHCRGRGAWNEMLHLDSFRCRLAICDRCDGSGWLRDRPPAAADDGLVAESAA